jgi:hypothetical protein
LPEVSGQSTRCLRRLRRHRSWCARVKMLAYGLFLARLIARVANSANLVAIYANPMVAAVNANPMVVAVYANHII